MAVCYAEHICLAAQVSQIYRDASEEKSAILVTCLVQIWSHFNSYLTTKTHWLRFNAKRVIILQSKGFYDPHKFPSFCEDQIAGNNQKNHQVAIPDLALTNCRPFNFPCLCLFCWAQIIWHQRTILQCHFSWDHTLLLSHLWNYTPFLFFWDLSSPFVVRDVHFRQGRLWPQSIFFSVTWKKLLLKKETPEKLPWFLGPRLHRIRSSLQQANANDGCQHMQECSHCTGNILCELGWQSRPLSHAL